MGGKVEATYHATNDDCTCGHGRHVHVRFIGGCAYCICPAMQTAEEGGGGASDPTPTTPPQQGAGVTHAAEEQET